MISEGIGGFSYYEELATRKAYELAEKMSERLGQRVTATVPGYAQRGGAPTAYDRIIATKFGVSAVNLLVEGESGKMVALVNNKVESRDLSSLSRLIKSVNVEDYALINGMAL